MKRRRVIAGAAVAFLAISVIWSFATETSRAARLSDHFIRFGIGTKPTTVAMALVFDSYIDPSHLLATERSQNVGYVWGAKAPELPAGSAEHDLYVAWEQGWCPGVGIYGPCPKGGPPSYPWIEKYHPDWLLWQANAKGVPTVPAHSRHNPGPILDFTNPAVQRYWMQHFIAPRFRLGFEGISWDNPVAYDPYGAVGHYDLHHHFVRLYSGLTQDPKYAAAQDKAIAQFLSKIRAIRPSVRFALNVDEDCLYADQSLWYQALRHIDTVFDEEGYTNWGDGAYPWITSSPALYCKNRWLTKTETFIALQKAGKYLIVDNEMPKQPAPYETDTNPSLRASMQWALANYLLVKYNHTYFWFGGVQHYGYAISMQREELADIGSPIGDMRAEHNVYVRAYTGGMALVNPSPNKTFTVGVAAGRYETLYGQPTNSFKLGPHSGIVLQVRT